jgi:hypothetical protein
MPDVVFRFLVLCLAASASAGCAVTKHLDRSILPQPSTTAMVQQWPLAVGLYVPPDVRSRVLQQVGEGILFEREKWNVPVGQEVASTFRWALEQMFAEVVVLEQAPSGAETAGRVAGVFELSDIRLGPHPLSFRTLLLDVALYSRSGERIDSWQVASPETGTGPEFAYVVRDAVAQFMARFADRPGVASWLAGEGIAATAARPVFRGDGDERPSGSRMLLSPGLRFAEAKTAMKCLRERLAHAAPPVDLISSASVRMDFFPWLEPSLAPTSVEDARRWLAEPATRQKLRALGVRHVLEFHGETKLDLPGGGMVFGGGFGAGGFFGYVHGTRESSFAAVVLDIEESGIPHDASVTERGSVHIPAFILPIPLIAQTESKACDELASRIHEMLTQNAHAE